MANKKAPLAWRQRGRNEAGGKQSTCPHSAGTDREAQGHTCSDCAFYREIPLPSGRRRVLCMLTGEKLRSSAKCCENFRPGKWAERGQPSTRYGRDSSAVPAPVDLCRLFAPLCWASWAAWPGMSLPGPRGLPSVLTSAQGGPPMFANVLTHAPRLRHSGFPQTTRGVASAFPASQEPEQVLPYISLLLSKLLPCIRMAGCLRILAGCNVRMSVRLRRLRVGRGALYPAFFIIPNYTRPL